jgi:lysozyme
MRQICKAAVDLIKSSESFSPTAYLCPVGIPTIGYGHTAGVLSADVGNRRITEAMGEQLLCDDLAIFCDAVEKLIKVSLTDGQFGALVSLAFNIGVGAFKKSTLLRRLNAGDFTGAAEQFSVWNKGGGRVLPGLVKRRESERILFCGGYDLGDN